MPYKGNVMMERGLEVDPYRKLKELSRTYHLYE
jgi:hypothetical protein